SWCQAQSYPTGTRVEPKPKPGLARLIAADPPRRSGQLLGLLLGQPAEPALEPGHSAAGVEDLLLAGVQRMAIRADIGVNLTVPRGAGGRKGVPACTGDLGHHVVGVNVALHCFSWFRRSPGRRAARTASVNRYRICRHTSVPHRQPPAGPADSRAPGRLT